MSDSGSGARSEPPRAAKRRGRTIVTALFAVPTCAFIVSSTWQLGVAVYATADVGHGGAATASVEDRRCLDGVRRLADGVVRARELSFRSNHAKGVPAESGLPFARALSPSWDEREAVEGVCADAPHAKDAFAAVMRLKAAEEALSERDTALSAPVWKDVQAYFE